MKTIPYIIVLFISGNLFCHAQSNDSNDSQRLLQKQSKFYVGADLGISWLNISPDFIPGNGQTCFSLGFIGGYAPTEWLRVGLGLSGYLIEASNLTRPDEGAGISTIYAHTRIIPFSKLNFYITLEGGFNSFWDNNIGGYNSPGYGFDIRLGYEIMIFKRIGLTLAINYGEGRFNKDVYDPVNDIYIENPTYTVRGIPIGVTYHF